jgi:VanZ family protein
MPLNDNLRRLARVGAVLCLVALMVLSWLPGEEMIRTGLHNRIEHFIAYAGTGLFLVAGFGDRVAALRLALFLVVYAGILELGQNFSPGRHAALFDFASSSAGGLVGIAVAHALIQRRSADPASGD